MDIEQKQATLREAVEKEIPPKEIDLWPNVRQAVSGTKPGATIVHSKNDNQNKRYQLALAAALVLLLLVLAGLTPAGRTFAQSLFGFFTPAEADTIPVAVADDAARVTSSAESELTVDVPTTAATAAPPSPYLTLAEAEAALGFPVVALAETPAGLSFLGVRLYGHSASVEYGTTTPGGQLILSQSQAGFAESSWDSVPADDIQQLQLGNVPAEAVQGTFVVYSGQTEATWNPDAPILRLRWEQNGIYYELTKFGDVDPIEYIDVNTLQEFALALISE